MPCGVKTRPKDDFSSISSEITVAKLGGVKTQRNTDPNLLHATQVIDFMASHHKVSAQLDVSFHRSCAASLSIPVRRLPAAMTSRTGLPYRHQDSGTTSTMTCGHRLNIHIITYNVHSLLADERLDLLMVELLDLQWDVLVFTETWREEMSEYFVLDTGHHFYGSGGIRGRCGVGFLIHKRWASHKFVPISTRLGFVDISFQNHRFRIFGIYMPQTTCLDNEVLEIYTCIDTNLETTLNVIVCGDFNAHVGQLKDNDQYHSILGENASFARNSRGDMLLQWCAVHDLKISNTMFQTSRESAWT